MATSKVSSSASWSLPPVPYPKEPVAGPLRFKRLGDKLFVRASDLYHDPNNERLYGRPGDPNWATSVYEMLDTFNERFQKFNDQFEIQVQPAIIYPDGLIDTGNTRSLGVRIWSLAHGYDDWLWVVQKSAEVKALSAYERQKQLAESNIARKETAYQEYRRFHEYRLAWCDHHQFPAESPFRTSPLEKLSKTEALTLRGVYGETRIALKWENLKRIDTIVRNEHVLKQKFPTLYNHGQWKQEIGRTRGIDYFYERVTGIPQGAKLVEDKYPTRDWTQILTQERLRRAATLTKAWVAKLFAGTVPVVGTSATTNFAPATQFEASALLPLYSHAYNVLLAEVLRNDGYVVTTPATNASFDFDLCFEFAGPQGVEYDKAEVKFTTFNGASTQWKGGHGKREGAFILVAVESSWQSVFIAMTRLNRYDWEPAGMDGTHCKVKSLLSAHRNELQYAAGTLVEKTNGAVEVQTLAL